MKSFLIRWSALSIVLVLINIIVSFTNISASFISFNSASIGFYVLLTVALYFMIYFIEKYKPNLMIGAISGMLLLKLFSSGVFFAVLYKALEPDKWVVLAFFTLHLLFSVLLIIGVMPLVKGKSV